VLISPTPSRWSRIPWLGRFLVRFTGEYRPYTWKERSPRARLAS
jgi:hypothetical protein